jgi:hypothetical protein
MTNAQMKIAVMDFRAGVGVENVDGMSGVFSTYFTPRGYTMVERTQIDRVIDEQGFQRSTLTQQQMVKIGQLLNIQKMVVGDVIVLNGQHDIDVRVVDVETGEVNYRDGETWAKGTSYRDAMRKLTERLVEKMDASAHSLQQKKEEAPMTKQGSVVTLYGYLKVFPEDLGTFPSPPNSVISAINADKSYGYNDWRIPTSEEMALIKANRSKIAGIGNGEYMTSDGQRSGTVRLVSARKTATETIKTESESEGVLINGVRWATRNVGSPYTFTSSPQELGNYYPFTQAQNVCPTGWRLPTRREFESLISSGYAWSKGGYLFAGGKLFFPVTRYEDSPFEEYWSSTFSHKNNNVNMYIELHLAKDRGVKVSAVGIGSDYVAVRCVAK